MKKYLYFIGVLSLIFSCGDEVVRPEKKEVDGKVARLNGHIKKYTLQDSIKTIEFYTSDLIEDIRSYQADN